MTKHIFDIIEFGAVAGDSTPCTAAIQKAIDVCAEDGGGQVYVPAGTFLIGTICLRSNVELHLAAGTTLLASSELTAFPERRVKHMETRFLPRGCNSCIIFAEDCENVAITGRGTINGNGRSFLMEDKEFWMPYRCIEGPTPARAVFFYGLSKCLRGRRDTDQSAGGLSLLDPRLRSCDRGQDQDHLTGGLAKYRWDAHQLQQKCDGFQFRNHV